VQTDDVIILPEPHHSGDLSSVSNEIQSNTSQRLLYGSKSPAVKSSPQNDSCSDELPLSSFSRNQVKTSMKSFYCKHLHRRCIGQNSPAYVSSSTAPHMGQRNQRSFDGLRPRIAHSLRMKPAYGKCVPKVTPRGRPPSSWLSDVRISGHCIQVGDQNHTSSCHPVINFSLNASGSMSLKSRCDMMENRSAADDSSHHLTQKKRQHYCKKASSALPKRDWNRPQIASESVRNTETSGSARSNFNHACVGKITPSSSCSSTKARARKHSGSNATALRPKYRRHDRSTLSNWQPGYDQRHLGNSSYGFRPTLLPSPACYMSNWQPRYDQNLANRSHGFRPMLLPSPACFFHAFFCGVLMICPHQPSVPATPYVFFPTFSIPIPLWCLGPH